MGGKRRIHHQGKQMLAEHYELIDSQKRAVIMENRLKQLEAEENRTIKNQRKAEEKAL